MKKLKKSSVLNNPKMIGVAIVDGLLFLHLLFNLPETYRFVSRKWIDIVIDKIVTPYFIQHMKYLVLFRNDQKINLKFQATMHSNRNN